MRVVVCGSRDFSDPFSVSLAIDARIGQLPEGSEVIHGAARGADAIAAEAAARRGHQVRGFPARWDELGNRAGVVRNLQMLDEGPELVIAFWDGQSRGTGHMIGAARERGIPVEVVAA